MITQSDIERVAQNYAITVLQNPQTTDVNAAYEGFIVGANWMKKEMNKEMDRLAKLVELIKES